MKLSNITTVLSVVAAVLCIVFGSGVLNEDAIPVEETHKAIALIFQMSKTSDKTHRVCSATCVATKGERHVFVTSATCAKFFTRTSVRQMEASPPLILPMTQMQGDHVPAGVSLVVGQFTAFSSQDDIALVEADFPAGTFAVAQLAEPSEIR